MAGVTAVARASKGAPSRGVDALARSADHVLATYAQVLFSRSRAAGALLLVATAVEPSALAHGLFAVVCAAVLSRLFGLRADGPQGYNALLVGLGVAHVVAPGAASALVVLGASVVVVLASAALASSFARASLPVLSLPFVLVHWALLGAAPLLPVAPAAATTYGAGPLEALGALFFLPRADAGALVLLGLVVSSRIAALLAVTGAALALGAAQAPAIAPMSGALVLDAALAAIAIGGVWFVPSGSSFALAGAGALVAIAAAIGLGGPLAKAGLPALILPFNLAVWATLLAARQRTFDRAPKSVDFVPGSPEENLAYFETRLARFRAPYAIAFRLPVRGAWTCTQAVDGALTHQAEWRHAFDFEVRGEDGRTFANDGARLEDHHCFKLPVLAAADGVVVKVVEGVADNAVGDMDVAHNWGNAIVIHHATGLYSLVAHLAKGSARVREGQHVRRGEAIALSGSSGRSPVPHLHFQLQSAPHLGAPTLPCRFSDAVVAEDRERVSLAIEPREGDTLRNLEPDDELAAFFAIEPGAVIALRSDAGEAEHLEHEVDLLGSYVLRSREHGATLAFARTDDTFTCYDALGSSRSALHLVRAALARVPFDAAPLEWTDYLPARWSRGSIFGPLRDFVAPFMPRAGLEMRYRLSRTDGALVVTGTSVKRRRGEPVVRTKATLARDRGLVAVEVTAGRARTAWTRMDAADEAFARARGAAEITAAPRRTVMSTLRKMRWVGVALLALAACARGGMEEIRREPPAPPPAVPAVVEVAPGGTDASAAFQKSYDDEASGNNDAALADLGAISVTGNALYVAELRRGWLLYKLGKHAESVSAYGRASAIEPAAIEPRVGALPPLSAQRRWTDVESMAREVLRKDPGNYTASIRLAFALYSQARWSDAEAAYRALLAMYPSDVEVRAGLGWSLLKGGKPKEAQQAFAEVLAVAPRNALALEGAAAARK